MNAYRFALRAQSRLAALLVAALMLALTAGAGSASAQRASAPADINARAQAPAVGLLAPGSGYRSHAETLQVRALQQRLRNLDQAPGPIDGLYGPQTQAAVERFQTTHQLALDGIAGPQTQHALRQAHAASTLTLGTGYDTPGGSQQVRTLQHQLHTTGQTPGPIDGLYGPQTQAAVRHYQTTHHLTPDGITGPQTQAAVRHYQTTHHPTPARSEQPTRSQHRTAQPAPRVSSPMFGSLAAPASEAFPAALLALIAWLIVLALIALRVLPRAKHPTTTPAAGVPAQPGRRPTPQTPADPRDTAPPHGGRVDGFELATAGAVPAIEDSRVSERVARGVELPVLGYVRVSDPADHNGDAFQAQAQAIDHACAGRGLRLIGLVRDHQSENGETVPRPGLSHALERVATGEAGGLVVARLQHLGTSSTELGALIAWFAKQHARLIAADLELDTGTDSGRLAAHTLASVIGLERRPPATHTPTRTTPAQTNGHETTRSAASDHPQLKDRIAAMRTQGMTLQAIADTLNTERVPTLRGGAKWRPSSVQTAAGYKRPHKKRPPTDHAITHPPRPKDETEGPDERGSHG